eukprot:m.31372 g.31372  ORF g.31372 m.31372 type:complete len:452 (-) comp16448_c0_seq1:49-1404(-)
MATRCLLKILERECAAPRLVNRIRELGFLTATDIQVKALPLMMKTKNDIILNAETGSGKTLAYMTPIASELYSSLEKAQSLAGHGNYAFDIQKSLIVVRSPELATQAAELFDQLMEPIGIKAAVLSKTRPLEMTSNIGVIIGTPGRLSKYNLKQLLPGCTTIVMDEVDALLAATERDVWTILAQYRALHYKQMNMVQRALNHLDIEPIKARPGSQKGDFPKVICAGATIPTVGAKSVGALLKQSFPTATFVVSTGAHQLVHQVDQRMVQLKPGDCKKTALLKLLSKIANDKIVIVFVNTSAVADDVGEFLSNEEFNVRKLHKRVPEEVRLSALATLYDDEQQGPRVIVATDLIARGLHINGLSYVIQYDFALDVSSYIHRVGRTARMGSQGQAISLVNADQKELASRIVNLTEDRPDHVLTSLFSRKRSFRKKIRAANSAAEEEARLNSRY